VCECQRLFIGADGIPFHGVATGEFVVFSARKMTVIVVRDVVKLGPVLERVIDGGRRNDSEV
jgi:hypothetical protein